MKMVHEKHGGGEDEDNGTDMMTDQNPDDTMSDQDDDDNIDQNPDDNLSCHSFLFFLQRIIM